jgi:hypothetical protein
LIGGKSRHPAPCHTVRAGPAVFEESCEIRQLEGLETREVQGLEFELAVGQRIRQIEFELARVEIARDLERVAGWLYPG